MMKLLFFLLQIVALRVRPLFFVLLALVITKIVTITLKLSVLLMCVVNVKQSFQLMGQMSLSHVVSIIAVITYLPLYRNYLPL